MARSAWSVAAAAALLLGACARPAERRPPAPSKLGDLSASLEAAREVFNAHRGEPRFLALLSPT
jgi:hypothetical protein